MKALELLKHALKGYSVHEKDIEEAITELEELQEELRVSDEAYALLLKEYHELKDKQ